MPVELYQAAVHITDKACAALAAVSFDGVRQTSFLRCGSFPFWGTTFREKQQENE